MHYLGGKARINRWIVDTLYDVATPDLTGYLEPFVGGGWVITEVCKRTWPGGWTFDVGDAQPDLIMLWQALQQGWQPPACVMQELYDGLRHSPPSPLRAFVGFGCSFSGKWWGGYARNNTGRNYASNARNSLLSKTKWLSSVEFKCQPYWEWLPENKLIYCDPPYALTTTYKDASGFDYQRFWDVVREWSNYNIVVVSEYQAPQDFVVVADKTTHTDMRCRSGAQEPRIERLFMYGEGIKVR